MNPIVNGTRFSGNVPGLFPTRLAARIAVKAILDGKRQQQESDLASRVPGKTGAPLSAPVSPAGFDLKERR